MQFIMKQQRIKRWSPLQGLRVKSRYDENGACHNTVAGSLIFE